jgi:malic enzyme
VLKYGKKKITDEMKIAAAEALAELCKKSKSGTNNPWTV